MKTAYYTLTTQDTLALGGELEKAAGGERQAAWIRQPERRAQVRRGGGNVIDLAAWKAAQEPEAPAEADWLDGPGGPCSEETPEAPAGPEQPLRRPRRDHSPRWPRGELAATLSVVAATAALLLWVLVF